MNNRSNHYCRYFLGILNHITPFTGCYLDNSSTICEKPILPKDEDPGNKETGVSTAFKFNCFNSNPIDRSSNRIIGFPIGAPWEGAKESLNLDIHQLEKLKNVNLSSKSLTSFPQDIFIYLKSALELDLSCNCLENLPSHFGIHMPNLNELHLHRNHLSQLPDDFGTNLQNLEKLFLNNNKISALPEKFGKYMKKLKFLNLTENRIREVTVKFCNYLPSLEYLYLCNNSIKKLPGDFGKKWPDLKELYCRDNKLTNLPKRFGSGMQNLLFLDLSSNELTKMPKLLLKYCPNLVDLNLQGNKLKTLPFEFVRTQRKFYINLCENPDFCYNDIPNVGVGLQSLRRHYGDYLLYNWDRYPSDSTLEIQKQSDLMWNFNNLTSIRKSKLKIEKIDISLDDYFRILKKFENFRYRSIKKGIFKAADVNIFQLVSDSLSFKLKISSKFIFDSIFEFIKLLKNRTNYEACFKRNLRYKADILNFISKIFIHLGHLSNVKEIQEILRELFSIIHYNNLFQYQDFYKLCKSVRESEIQEDPIENFVLTTILDYKNSIFESTLWANMQNPSIRMFFVWYLALQYDLDLKIENYEISFTMKNYKSFRGNKKLLKDKFYTKFTPQNVINHLIVEIRKNFEISDKEICKALTIAVGGNIKKVTELNFSQLDKNSINRKLFKLFKNYLKKRGLLADD